MPNTCRTRTAGSRVRAVYAGQCLNQQSTGHLPPEAKAQVRSLPSDLRRRDQHAPPPGLRSSPSSPGCAGVRVTVQRAGLRGCDPGWFSWDWANPEPGWAARCRRAGATGTGSRAAAAGWSAASTRLGRPWSTGRSRRAGSTRTRSRSALERRRRKSGGSFRSRAPRTRRRPATANVRTRVHSANIIGTPHSANSTPSA
jgi:hypothetical protein